MVKIEHRGHAIETEAIEAEFLQPVTHIGEQELQSLFLTVVEEFGVPKVVVAARARMQVLAVGAVKQVDAFANVFHRVGVHQIHDDQHTHAMRRVDEFF